jgi:ferritin-like metal-binding protein YciE
MSLHDVLISELRDLYSAELQLTKALPKMVRAAKTPELKTGFTEHVEQTKGHVERLKEVFQHIGKKPTGETCHGMMGLVEEAQEQIGEDLEPQLKDVALAGAALRIEHYEVAGYTTAILIAKQLGEKEIVSLLTQTLEEEKATAKLLLANAKPMLKAAAALGA